MSKPDFFWKVTHIDILLSPCLYVNAIITMSFPSFPSMSSLTTLLVALPKGLPVSVHSD